MLKVGSAVGGIVEALPNWPKKDSFVSAWVGNVRVEYENRNSHDFCNVQEPGALRCAYDGLIADRGKVCNLIRFVARHPLSTSNCHCVARKSKFCKYSV